MSYRYPFPPFADGWFQIAYSGDVASGQAIPLSYFGKELVLFRDESGKASVLDAFCPHLGAHLGHGGKVVGDCIECPFHAWKFNGEGACTEVPYATRIPPKAKIEPWHMREINGMILVWHHGLGEAPSWEPPVFTEHEDDAWTPYSTRKWKIRAHNQEMAENAVDSAHFRYLHGTHDMPTLAAERKGPLLHCHADTKMRAYGTIVTGALDVHCYGFGYSTTRFTGIVETFLIGSVVPVDQDHVELRFSFTVKKGPNEMVTNTVADRFQAEIERQLEADIPVWENKIFLERPALCDGDGPIGIFRKWCRQFYSMPMPDGSTYGQPST